MKQDRRIAATRQMIKEALLRLLETKPLDRIKIKELCQESGVNRATFYRHYETLRDVLREMELELLRQMPRPSGPLRDVTEARSHMETVCAYFYDHGDRIRLLLRNRTDQDMLQGMTEFYRSLLELRKEETPACEVDEDTAKAVIALVGGGGQCLLRQWLLGDIQKTPAQIAAILCSVIRWPDAGDLT